MKAVRGMHDLFGSEMRNWRWVENEVKAVLSGFGYSEIRTPVLEQIEVFSQTVGDETDIVEKQMYQVVKENETLVLRPEGTAGFMRAVLEHQLHREPGAGRYFYYEPMFRHERPQKGRLRQFHQFGAELINDGSPQADAEIIALLDAIYRRFGLAEYEVRINSVGCDDCRPVYREKLKAYFQPKLNELCEQCRARFERAPMRILDCKRESCQKLVSDAPLITDSLCGPCRTHHAGVKEALSSIAVPFIDDPKIVRGLDYYLRTAFEFTSNLLGAQSALGGGGRYDGLASRFGEKPFPAVGFGLGMERLVIALEASGKLKPQVEPLTLYVAALGVPAQKALFPKAMEWKRAGLTVELPYESEKSLKSHLKNANRLGAQWALIVGDDELKAGQAILKNMVAGTQESISIAGLSGELPKKIKGV